MTTALVSLVAVVATAVALVVIPEADEVTDADLNTLLLSPREVQSILGEDYMAPTSRGDSLPDILRVVPDPKECAPIVDLLPEDLADEAGYVTMRRQSVFAAGEGHLPHVAQAAVEFASGTDAQRFYDSSASSWRNCLDLDVVIRYDDDTKETNRFDQFTDDAGTMTVRRTLLEAQNGFVCQNVMTVELNVAVVVRACGFDVTDQGRDVARKVADRVGAHVRPGGEVRPQPDPLPELAPLMPTAGEMTGLAKRQMTLAIDSDGLVRPQGPGYATQPPGCAAVSRTSQATTYVNLPWTEARRAEYRHEVDPDPAVVATAIVLATSESAAESFLDQMETQWQKCEGVDFSNGTVSTVTFTDTNVVAAAGRISATFRDAKSAVECAHVLAVKGAFLVEGQSCGAPPIDVQKLVDAMLAGVPD